MTDTQKTIRMPATTLEKWLAALRSGKYVQAKNKLYKDGGYCCLGVLQCVVDGAVELCETTSEASEVDGEIGDPMSLPRDNWMKNRGIQTKSNSDADWKAYSNLYIYTEDDGFQAAPTLNDEREWSFEQIADAVEACTETY